MNQEERIEDLAIYKLDYETQPIAAGGEVLQPGDHVYMWCTLYQHHGIVLETDTWTVTHQKEEESRSGGKDEQQQSILIAEFTNVALLGAANNLIQSTSTASGALSTAGVTGGFRFVKEMTPSQWHVVKYQANPFEIMTWRPGTCSSACPSSVETILTRVHFLNACRHLIPDYHILASNCETVAVWCRTGEWETLQGDGALRMSQIGAVAAAGVVPVPGAGIVAGGLALWHARGVNQKLEKTAERLNKEFQWYAMGKTPNLKFRLGA